MNDKIDRLSIRHRPPGLPVMYQTWGKLLFIHWPFPAESLRPMIPPRLELDTHEGSAWIAIAPFTMWGVRPALLPPIPGLSAFHELNVRTYVHLDGVPGVWFFSLDAANAAAVWAARRWFGLPYFNAEMHLVNRGQSIDYRSRRKHLGAPAAEFEAVWTIGNDLPEAEPGSLEFFLTERYCLYAVKSNRLYRGRIFHRPWSLKTAKLNSLRSTMIEAAGLSLNGGDPLLHYSEVLDVAIWSLVEV